MKTLRTLLPGLIVIVCSWRGLAQQPAAPAAMTANAIMMRVAANQDRAQLARGHYVYAQHVRILSRKGSKVMCEEVTDSRLTPSASGSHSELLKLDGRVLQGRTYLTYTSLPSAKGSGQAMVDTNHDAVTINVGDDDREMVESLRSSLTRDDSKDGINSHLFPLTSTSQADYLFHLVGLERLNGRDVFHLDFRPKDKSAFDWKGDAWVDSTAFEPVVVSTGLSRNFPFAVRALLGTNAPGLGFTVVYAPQPDGVWFPVSFGTEFKVHVLFFFKREIVIDAHNRDFEKTSVSSKIVGAAVAPE